MTIVQETNEGITFTETVPRGLRIFFCLIGLVPMLLAPYQLLFQPPWQEFSRYMVIPILVSLGAILVGGLLIAAGLFGLNQTLQVLVRPGVIHYSFGSALIPVRTKTFRFSDVAKFELKTNDWGDGPPTYRLQFVLDDGQKIETGSFANREQAKAYLDKIASFLFENKSDVNSRADWKG